MSAVFLLDQALACKAFCNPLPPSMRQRLSVLVRYWDGQGD